MATKKRKMNEQRKLFCDRYIHNGRNGAEAYGHAYPKSLKHDAHYRAKRAGELLAHRDIIGTIEALEDRVRKIAEEKFEITTERIVQEFAASAIANADDYFEWGTKQRPLIHRGKVVLDEAGEPVMETVPFVNIKPSDQLTRVQKKAIAGAEMTVSRDGTPMVSVKLHDKLAALKSLGQHLGMFKIDVNMQGKGGGPLQLVISNAEANA